MDEKTESLNARCLYKKYVRGTGAEALVVLKTGLVCHLTRKVALAIQTSSIKVHINTKIIKHLYDKKPAEEFEFVIDNIHVIVKFPEEIYRNPKGKRGDFSFIKTIDGKKYIVSLEINETDLEGGKKEVINYVVTAFRIRKESYLKNYQQVWSWTTETQEKIIS